MSKLLKGIIRRTLCLGITVQVSAQSKPKAAGKHTIAQGENLYVVARKYGVTLADLQKANPSLKGTLAVGQEVIVPAGGTAKPQAPNITLPVSNSVVKMSKPGVVHSVAAPKTALANAAKPGTYQVKPGETLLGIANRNQITVEELQKANKLSGTSIKVGQSLIIPGMKSSVAAKPAAAIPGKPTAASVPAPAKHLPTGAKVNTVAPTAPQGGLQTRLGGPGQEEQSYFSGARLATTGKKAFRESGIATMIDGRLKTGKMLALHRTAPIGSTLQVRNSMTGQMVNVRVIGKLPDIGLNDKVVVKLSKKAYEKLGAGDRRSMVEVNSI